jgi:hypothetical protein
MTFKAKPVRPTVASLKAAAEVVGAENGSLPATILPQTAPVAAPEKVRKSRPPTVIVNMKASLEFARIIGQEAEKYGGLRRMLAHMLAERGLPVPEYDLNPPSTRRKYE